MKSRDVVQQAVDDFASGLGGRRRSGSWFVDGADAIAVVNLQKSRYGPRYYLNIGYWFLELGSSTAPPPSHCHLQSRADVLVGEASRERLNDLLNLAAPMPDVYRLDSIAELLSKELLPVLTSGLSLQGLATEAGQWLLTHSLVNVDGQHFLGDRGLWPVQAT